MESSFPDQGLNPQPPALEGEVLTTGWPGKSQHMLFGNFKNVRLCELSVFLSFLDQSRKLQWSPWIHQGLYFLASPCLSDSRESWPKVRLCELRESAVKQ